MESENTYSDELLNELERLLQASEAGDFRTFLDTGNLTGGDARAAQLINKISINYRKIMRGMIEGIERRDDLMKLVNKAAATLLKSGIDDFENDLRSCMGTFAKAVDVDRICIWRNTTQNGKLYYYQAFKWEVNDDSPEDGFSAEKAAFRKRDLVCYDETVPSWKEALSQGRQVSSLVRDMPPAERGHFASQGIVAVCKMPIFIQDQFWGFVGYDNYHLEKLLTENEQTSMLSGSLLLANALLQYETQLDLQATAVRLEEALYEAEAANTAKSEFLANMSHEMRTPLNAIIGLTWLCLENEYLDQDTRSNLEKTHNAGTTLLGIVNDILDISKIESGRLELVPVEYNVASLINDAVTQNLLRIGEKPITLKLDIDKEMYTLLFGDELRLKQIMNNLLSNAIKYTTDGEVELTTFCVREGDAVWLTIKVRDTGKGIKSEDIEVLFKNYSQLDMKENRETEGTGLGLPITKRLCELMNGSVTVESEYGAGSVFTARVLQTFVSDARIGPENVSSLNSFRYSDGRRDKEIKLKRIRLPYAQVLIVDDNLTNLDVARGLMKPYGMFVDCVDSGQKAIDAVSDAEGKYDAIFMDHMMPGMDGIEATRRIRQLPSGYARKVPIIALTANAVVGSEEMFLSKGFQAYLSKPIDIARLDAVIRQWIRNQEKEQSLTGADPTDEPQKEVVSMLNSKEVPGLNLVNGIRRFNGDEEVYVNILHSYSVNTRGLLDSIETVSEDKIKSYEIAVHSLKGSSLGICAEVVGEMAAGLEYAAKTGDFDYINMHNQQFLTVAWKLIDDLETFLSDLEAEHPKPVRDLPDFNALSKLLGACISYDMDGADAAMEEIRAFQYKSDGGLADWLYDNVEVMNFTDIIDKLKVLLADNQWSVPQ